MGTYYSIWKMLINEGITSHEEKDQDKNTDKCVRNYYI